MFNVVILNYQVIKVAVKVIKVQKLELKMYQLIIIQDAEYRNNEV